MSSPDTQKAKSGSRSRQVGMVLWAMGTLLAAVSAWLLWKVYGRQLVAAPGEILLSMTRPNAIEPPYPVQDLGGQWGLLIIGELPARYGRMTALLESWWLGAALLFVLVWVRVSAVGMATAGRVLVSLAGTAVFVTGFLLLQASFRMEANYGRFAGIGALDPFLAAQLLPLSVATKACFSLVLGSLFLSAAVALNGRGRKGKGGAPAVEDSGFLPRSIRMVAFRVAVLLSFVSLGVWSMYAVWVNFGPIPELLPKRLADFEQAYTVERLNGILGGLRYSGVAVQLAGMLWVVAAWLAPSSAGKAPAGSQ